MTPRKLILFFILSFALALCIHAILIAEGFFGISADESGRTLDALAWIFNSEPLSNVWLPFHRVVLSLGLWISHDLFIVPRVISFIFGLLTLACIAWMTQEAFHDRTVTAWATLLAALFPPRVILAVVPLSEIEFATLLVAGFAGFLHWLRSHRPSFLLLAVFFAGLSTSVRYEGWLFAGALVAMFLFSADMRERLLSRPVVGTSALALIIAFPVFWIIHTYLEMGTPFAFASSTISHYEQSADTSVLKLLWRNPLTQFFYQNGMTLNVIGCLSMIGLLRSRKHVRVIVLIFFPTLVAMALLALFGKALPTHNPWRVPVVWSCLLLPFTAYWIVYDVKKLVPAARRLRTLVPLIILAAFGIQTGVMTRNPFFSHTERTIGLLLQSALTSEGMDSSKVLIETSDWSYLNIALASNLPNRFVYNTGFEPYHPLPPVLDPQKPVRANELIGKGIRILVFKSDLLWTPLERFFVRKRERCGAWNIYRIGKIPSSNSEPAPLHIDTTRIGNPAGL